MLPSTRSSQLSYAPVPHIYTSNRNLSTKVDLDQEIQLTETGTDVDLFDSLSEIYGIIITLEGLEKAYIRDSIEEQDYTELCNRLLKQYKYNLQDVNTSQSFVDLETFKNRWEIECPRATERLRISLPASVTDAAPRGPPSNANVNTIAGNTLHEPFRTNQTKSGSLILAATENFITFLDAIKLNMLSKDALHPLLAELIQSVNAVTDQDFDGRAKIITWLIRLNALRAQEEVQEGDARELGFDIEVAYRGFKSTLT